MAAMLVPGLERRLKAEISGEVGFDPFTRGRYATDASHYQMMPLGVVLPRTMAEDERAIVLDDLNRAPKPHGLWFPVDISTASRATIGGMAGNNSCGARSLRYGNTRENVLSIDAAPPNGASQHFGPTAPDLSDIPAHSPLFPIARDLVALAAQEAEEIESNFPKVQRRV